jgi:uncharacterized integral membrane protein
MSAIPRTAEQAAKRRRQRGFLLLTLGALILLAGVIVALLVYTVHASTSNSAAGPSSGFDWSAIIAALIGAVPGTVTAVTGLIIVMRSRTEQAAPSAPQSQRQAPPPPSKP